MDRSVRTLCGLMAVLFLLVSASTVAAQKTWDGSEGTSWNDADNWNPSGVPTSTDDVTIANVTNMPSTYVSDPECDDLTIDSGATLTLGSGFDLTVNGNLQIDGTLTVAATNSDIAVAGDWINDGTFNNGGAFVDLTSTGDVGGTSTTVFNELDISGGTRTATAAIEVDGDIGISGGVTFEIGSFTHDVAGNWTSSGGSTTISGTGFIEFTGNGQTTTLTNGLPNVRVSGGDRNFQGTTIDGELEMTGGSIDIQDDVTLTVDGVLDLQAGTLDFTSTTAGDEVLDVAGNATLTCTAGTMSSTVFIRANADWSSTSAWDPSAGTVELDGTGTNTISGASPTFFDLRIVDGTKNNTSALDIDGDLTVDSGATLDSDAACDIEGDITLGDGTSSWDLGTSTHTAAGDYTSSGGSATGTTGKIDFDAAGSMDTGGGSIRNALVSAGARTVSTSTIANDLEMSGGSIDIGDNQTLTVSNDVSFTGGTLNFTAGAAGDEVLDVTNDVTMSSTADGTFSSESLIEVSGDWSSDSTFSPSAGVVELDGAGTNTVGGASPTFFDLTIADGTKQVTAAASIVNDLTVNDGAILDATAALDIDGNVSLGNATAEFDTGGLTHTVAGDYSSNGADTSDSAGTIDLDGTGSLSISSPGTLPNVLVSAGTRSVSDTTILGTLDMTGGTTEIEVQDNQSLAVFGDVTLTAGTLSFDDTTAGIETLAGDAGVTITCTAGTMSSNTSIFCRGAWSSTSAFSPTDGTVTFFVDSSTVGGTSPVLPNVDIASGTRTFSVSTTINGDLTVQAGATLDTDAAQDINGDVTLGNATSSWDLGAFTHTISGDYTSTGGDATSGALGGTLRFDGAGDLTTASGVIENVDVTVGTRQVFGALVSNDVTMSGGEIEVQDNTSLVVGNDLTITGGTLSFDDTTGGNENIDVANAVDISGLAGLTTTANTRIFCADAWTSDATFAPSSGLVSLDGNSSVNVGGTGLTFFDLTVVNGTKTVTSAATIGGDLTVNSGATLDTDAAIDVSGNVSLGDNTASWDMGAITHVVDGDYDSSGADATGGGLIRFEGPGDLATGGGSIDNVEIFSGARLVSDTDITTDLTVSGGQLRIQDDQTVTVGNDAALNAGALAFDDTTAGLETLDVENDVTLTSAAGTTSANTRIFCGGDWSSTSAWTPGAGLVTLDGAGSNTITGTDPTFFDLTIATGTKQGLSPVDVNGDLDVADGAIFDSDGVVTVLGNVTLNTTGTWQTNVLTHAVTGSWTATGGDATETGTIEFNGFGTTGTGGGSIPNMLISANIRLMNSTEVATDLTMTGGTLRVLNDATVHVAGDADLQGGTVAWFGTADATDDVLDVDGQCDVLASSGGTSASSVFRCGGQWQSTSAFSPAGGTVILDESATADIIGTGVTFANLQVESGSRTNQVAVNVAGDLTIDDGASLTTADVLDVDGDVNLGSSSTFAIAALTHTVAGDFTSTGSSVTGTGIIDFDGSGTVGMGGGSIPNVTVSAGTRQADTTDVGTDLDVTGGELNVNADQTVTVGNDFTVGASAVLSFDSGGASNEVIDVAGTCDITGIAGSTSTEAQIFCAGTWTSSSAWTPTDGTVILDGGASNVNGTLPTFFNLEINSGTKTVTVAADVDNDLTIIDAATLDTDAAITVDGDVDLGNTSVWDLGAFNHVVGGSWTSTGGSATDAAGSVEFSGFGSITTSTGSIPNASVTLGPHGVFDSTITGDFSMSAGSITIQDDATLTVNGNVDLNGGTLNWTTTVAGGSDIFQVDGNAVVTCSAGTTTANSVMSVDGDWESDSTFAPTDGTVSLGGASPSNITGAAGLDPTFNDLVVSNSTRTVTNDITLDVDTLTINGGGEVDLGGQDVTIPGTVVTVNGQLTLGVGANLALGATVAMAVNSGGTLSMIGDATDKATITGDAGGGYLLVIDGTLEASNFCFEQMGAGGIEITDSATIGAFPNDMRGGTFNLGSSLPNSTLLDIERAVATEFRYVDFDDSGTVTYNAQTTSGSGAVTTFVNSLGNYSGAGNENDPFNKIDWTSDLTTLADFTATPGLNLVTIDWETFTEVDVTDFIVERGTAPGGPFTTVDTQTAVGPTTYQFIDNTVTGGTTYYYNIVQVLTHGANLTLDQRSATPWDSTLPANMVTVGPSGDFTDIQSAINSFTTEFNPAILVETGTYASFTIGTGILGTLRLVSDGSGPITIDTTSGPVTITGLLATEDVVISDFTIGSGGSTHPAVVVQNCAGVVILDESDLTGGAGQPGIRIDNSDATALQRTDVTGTPGILAEGGSTAVGSNGTLSDIDLFDSSFVRLASMTPGSSFVEAGSTLTDYGTSMVHSDIDMPELAPLTSPFFIDMTGEPFGLWGLWLTVGGVEWTDFTGLRWEMPALIQFGFSVLLLTLPFDGTGTISFPVTLPADGALIGFPIEWQILVVHPSTLKRRWSNIVSVISTP